MTTAEQKIADLIKFRPFQETVSFAKALSQNIRVTMENGEIWEGWPFRDDYDSVSILSETGIKNLKYRDVAKVTGTLTSE